MKILVISLLRMGDIIMATPTLRGLRKRYPNSRIDLMFNSQFKGLTALVPHVDRFVEFDRELLQHGMGTSRSSLFEPFDHMKTWIDDLKTQEYDLVINLTHNRLSGYLASLIAGRETIGLSIDTQGLPRFGSNWFRHLNRFGLDREGAYFHYSDLFYFGSQLGDQPERFELKESLHGMDAIENMNLPKDFLVLQVSTSDSKKDFPLSKVPDCIRHFQLLRPTTKILFLCSPQQKNFFSDWIRQTDLVNCDIVDCDLEVAFSLLKRCSLLVTVDTGIKHLGSAAGCKIIELSVGSSNFRSTGVYRDGSLILQSNVSCAPCGHSSSCSQVSHLCTDNIPPDLFGLIWAKYLDGDREGLRILAKEASPELSLFVVSSSVGHWSAVPIHSENSVKSIVELLDQLSWRLTLEKEHEKRMPQIGTYSEKLLKSIHSLISYSSTAELSDQLSILERSIERFEGRVEVLIMDFQQVLKSKSVQDDLAPFLSRLRRTTSELKEDQILLSYGRSFERALEDVNGNEFSFIRKIRECLVDTKNRIQMENKIVRSLRSHIQMEANA